MYALLVLAIALLFYGFSRMNKTNTQEPSAGTADATTADEGNSIVVIFGTCDVSPNVVGFKAGTPRAIKKKA